MVNGKLFEMGFMLASSRIWNSFEILTIDVGNRI